MRKKFIIHLPTNIDATRDRNEIAENTKLFINERLEVITNELEGVEQDAENYKKSLSKRSYYCRR